MEAMLSRVRSPLLGSVLIAFTIINWKAIFFVVFSASTAVEKFEFFDQQTTVWTLLYAPIAVGLVLGLASPWISLFGAWAASQPVQQQRILTDRLASERLFQRAKLAKARELEQTVLEETLIDRAKRDQEIDSIDDVNRREQVRNQITSSRTDIEERERLRLELEEAEETRDQAISYLQQREYELNNQLSQTEAELRAAMDGLRDARREAEDIRTNKGKKN